MKFYSPAFGRTFFLSANLAYNYTKDGQGLKFSQCF